MGKEESEAIRIKLEFTPRELSCILNHAQLAVAIMRQDKEAIVELRAAAYTDMSELGMEAFTELMLRIGTQLPGIEGMQVKVLSNEKE